MSSPRKPREDVRRRHIARNVDAGTEGLAELAAAIRMGDRDARAKAFEAVVMAAWEMHAPAAIGSVHGLTIRRS